MTIVLMSYGTYPTPWVPWIHSLVCLFIVSCPNWNKISRKAGMNSPGSLFSLLLSLAPVQVLTPEVQVLTPNRDSISFWYIFSTSALDPIPSHLLKGVVPLTLLPLLSSSSLIRIIPINRQIHCNFSYLKKTKPNEQLLLTHILFQSTHYIFHLLYLLSVFSMRWESPQGRDSCLSVAASVTPGK